MLMWFSTEALSQKWRWRMKWWDFPYQSVMSPLRNLKHLLSVKHSVNISTESSWVFSLSLCLMTVMYNLSFWGHYNQSIEWWWNLSQTLSGQLVPVGNEVLYNEDIMGCEWTVDRTIEDWLSASIVLWGTVRPIITIPRKKPRYNTLTIGNHIWNVWLKSH